MGAHALSPCSINAIIIVFFALDIAEERQTAGSEYA
jgi:hypothetical protein